MHVFYLCDGTCLPVMAQRTYFSSYAAADALNLAHSLASRGSAQKCPAMIWATINHLMQEYAPQLSFARIGKIRAPEKAIRRNAQLLGDCCGHGAIQYSRRLLRVNIPKRKKYALASAYMSTRCQYSRQSRLPT